MGWLDFLNPDPNQQQQAQQQPAPQQNDWGSLAKSLLPGVLPGVAGLAFGGKNRGLYGAYGFAEGMADQEEQGIKRQQYNNELALKQQHQAAQQKHWDAADQVAAQNAQLHQVQMRKAEQELAESQTDAEARERYASRITDPAERDRFLVDPKGYMKDRLGQEQLKGAGQVLTTLGVKDGDALAQTLGPKGSADLIEAMAKSRYAQKPFEHYDSESGMFIYGEPGNIKTQRVVDVNKEKNSKDPERAHAIMTEARQQVEALFKGSMGEMRLEDVPGNTPPEKAKSFQRMIDERARQLANERGLGNLFQPMAKSESERAGDFIRQSGGAAPERKQSPMQRAQPQPGGGAKAKSTDTQALPNPPAGKMIIRNKETGEQVFYPSGDIPTGWSRLR